MQQTFLWNPFSCSGGHDWQTNAESGSVLQQLSFDFEKNVNNSFDWRPAPRGRDSNRSCLFYSRLVSRWQFQVWDNKACFVVNCIVFHVVYSKEASAHNRRLQSPLCLFSAPTVAAFNSCSPFLCWRPDCCQAARSPKMDDGCICCFRVLSIPND